MAQLQKKHMRWPKERIREELILLDRLTGLDSTGVTVKFYDRPEPLACFTFADPARMTFGFSALRFEDTDFTETEALGVIRHEYAHYMEYMIYHESSDHGPNWKKCCNRIGARSDKLYTGSFQKLAREKEHRKAQTTSINGFQPGKKLVHPAYGEGVVESFESFPTMTILNIRFSDGNLRSMDVNWIRKNCASD